MFGAWSRHKWRIPDESSEMLFCYLHIPFNEAFAQALSGNTHLKQDIRTLTQFLSMRVLVVLAPAAFFAKEPRKERTIAC